MAELRQLADESFYRLGPRQAFGFLPLEFPVRQRLRGSGSRDLCRPLPLHRWTSAPGHAAIRFAGRRARAAASGAERLHVASASSPVVERVVELFAAAAPACDVCRS